MYLHVYDLYGKYIGSFNVFGNGFTFQYASGQSYTGTVMNQGNMGGRTGNVARAHGFMAVYYGILIEEGGQLAVDLDGASCIGIASRFPTPPVMAQQPRPAPGTPPPPMPPPEPAKTGEGDPAPAGSQEILKLTSDLVELTIEQDPSHMRYHFSCLGKTTRSVTLGSMSWVGDHWVLKKTDADFATLTGLTPEMTPTSAISITFTFSKLTVPLTPVPTKQAQGRRGTMSIAWSR